MNIQTEPPDINITELDLLPLDSVTLLQRPFQDRFTFGQKFIRENPLVDKAKPMLYAGSGGDLGIFLGSGIAKAYYVDPHYLCSNTGEADESMTLGETNSDLSTLIAQIRLVADKDAAPPEVVYGMNEKGEFDSTSITFYYLGERREIVAEAADATFYIPDELTRLGCSAYLSFGVPDFLLTPPPGLTADIYVVSSFLPEMMGYGGINHEAITYPYEMTVAMDYELKNLEYVNYHLYGSSNFAAVDSLFERLMGWDEAAVREHAQFLERRTGSSDLEVGTSIFFSKLLRQYSKCDLEQRQLVVERYKDHINHLIAQYGMKEGDIRLENIKKIIFTILDQLTEGKLL